MRTNMTIDDAKAFIAGELARIERQNPDKELRPWMRDACPASSEHWGRVQQRIALNGSNPRSAACCASLKLDAPEWSLAQKRAAEANGRRLATAKAAA
jgi:hypothetical protein